MGEEIANSITHGIGVILGIIALVIFVIKGYGLHNALYTVSMVIYASSLYKKLQESK